VAWLELETMRPNWLWVLLPPSLPEGHTGTKTDSVAAQIHLALSLMKVPNVVSVESHSVNAMSEEREKTLNELSVWMWDITDGT
jgi:hypothetical protein